MIEKVGKLMESNEKAITINNSLEAPRGPIIKDTSEKLTCL